MNTYLWVAAALLALGCLQSARSKTFTLPGAILVAVTWPIWLFMILAFMFVAAAIGLISAAGVSLLLLFNEMLLGGCGCMSGKGSEGSRKDEDEDGSAA